MESERVKEERLSKLRMGEYAQKQFMDDQQAARDRARLGAASSAIEAKVGGMEGSQTGQEVDENGDPIGVIEGARKLTPREQSSARIKEAQARGEDKLVGQYEKQHKDLTEEERTDRQIKLDESKTKTAERLAAIKELDLAIKEKDADTRARKVDALIARALGGEDGKEPAKVKEVKWLADTVFGGDLQKATAFAYGAQDKDNVSAVTQIANMLKDDPDYRNFNERLAKAQEVVNNLRGVGTSRGGVKVSTPDTPIEANTGPGIPVKPRSQAEFDQLPKNARYVNPADGKIYIKK
jgi:hypothetical protein